MKSWLISIIALLAILIIVGGFFSQKRYKESTQELNRLEALINGYEMTVDSLAISYKKQRIQHSMDTLRLVNIIKDQELKYKQAQLWWYEKISSIDHISSDSARSYLSDRYKLE